MRFHSKRGAGLEGALALIFLAFAGAGAFVFARHRANATPVEQPRSQPTAAELTPEEKKPVSPAATTLAAGMKHQETKPAVEKKPAPELPASLPVSSPDAKSLLEKAEAALAKGDERNALLTLRAVARARARSPEQETAKERLAKIASDSLEEAAKHRESGDSQAERAALSRAFFSLLDRSEQKPVRERLDDLVRFLVFSLRPSDDGEVYTVKQGDRLIPIARAHKTTFTFIRRASCLKSDSIRVGQKLKIPRGAVELAVWKTDFLLVATLGGRYLKAWEVGTGKEDRTPEAAFKISERIVEPTWYSPDGKVYPFGTKENILGTRWLGFERTPELAGFGIHGTAFPETIGTEASMGCIRMRNEDVEEVFDLVPDGAEVRIVR